jgi:hypothetical protein
MDNTAANVMDTIIHEYKLGTLTLTISENATEYTLVASFALAEFNRVYSAAFKDAHIRQLCVLFAEAPYLVQTAIQVMPEITYDVLRAKVTAMFTFTALERAFMFHLELSEGGTH